MNKKLVKKNHKTINIAFILFFFKNYNLKKVETF